MVRKRQPYRSSWGTPPRPSKTEPTRHVVRADSIATFLVDPELKESSRNRRWSELSKAVGDDPKKLCENILEQAARIGFGRVSKVHLDSNAVKYAQDRRTAGSEHQLARLDRRSRAVLLAKGELTARLLGAENRHQQPRYKFADDAPFIDRTRRGTEPVLSRTDVGDVPPPGWFGWKPKWMRRRPPRSSY